MQCLKCGSRTRTIDTRETTVYTTTGVKIPATRRRRLCPGCDDRGTTYEIWDTRKLLEHQAEIDRKQRATGQRPQYAAR